MKTKIILLIGLITLATLCTARPAEEEYEYEDEASPPPKKAPARPLIGRRNPLAGKTSKATSTTTTTAAPEPEEEAPVEGDYEDEQPVETSSTTETNKKFIRGGIIRPFRSNTDLLATLKKRREQVVSNKKPIAASASESNDDTESEPVQKETKSAATPAGRRNRFSKTKPSSNEVPAEEASSTAASTRTARGRFSART